MSCATGRDTLHGFAHITLRPRQTGCQLALLLLGAARLLVSPMR
jgi:hypothetical protein